MSGSEQLMQKEISQLLETGWQPATSSQVFKEKLASYINYLITNDFNKLIYFLRRLDVSEEKLKLFLTSSAAPDAGNLIADMMIEREMQKIQTREQFKQEDKIIDEEEKW